jgi:hypothetical protein
MTKNKYVIDENGDTRLAILTEANTGEKLPGIPKLMDPIPSMRSGGSGE